MFPLARRDRRGPRGDLTELLESTVHTFDWDRLLDTGGEHPIESVPGGRIAHRLADAGRAAELRLLRHLAATAPDLLVPRPSDVVTVEGQNYATYPILGQIDLQRALPVDGSAPPRPPGYDQPGDAVDMAGLGRALGELGHDLALLHRATPPVDSESWARDPAFRLLDPAEPAEAYTRRELELAVRRAAASGFVTRRHWRALRRVHEQLSTIAFDRIGFVHFALHPRNVRLRVTDRRVGLAGMIDFNNAHYWLPEFDLAVMRWHLAGLPAKVSARFFTAYQLITERPLHRPTVRLCEVIRLAFVLANGRDRAPGAVRWYHRRWDAVLEEYVNTGPGTCHDVP